MYRQGDVLLIRSESKFRPERESADEQRVLATGEKTGHAHVLEGPSAALEGKLFVFENSKLVHEEHDTILIPPGIYMVVRQSEWDGQQSHNVSD